MKIITAGAAYLDIDAYAGIIAYAELLQKQGHAAQAVSTAAPNESVTKTVRSWPVSLETTYRSSQDDTFTLIDISAPDHFDTFVSLDQVEAVIDHHPGHEAYWQEKIGDSANIEAVGAACTLVYECWQKAGLAAQISETSARLLICGILDNTLNFGAKITTERDKIAYEALMKRANLPSDWPAQYFGECQEAIDKDPVVAIQNDTKNVRYPGYENDIAVGQCAVWSAVELLHSAQADLVRHFGAKNKPWCINIISISERKSYFLSSDAETQEYFSELLGLTFEGVVAAADRPWLRKEILQVAIDKAS